MPQVSRRFLHPKTQERIFSLFISSIILSNSKEKALSLVEDLLTPTEKIMLAKRFSIAYMLIQGYQYSTITQTLKVSKSTVGQMGLWLKHRGNGIRHIISSIKRNESLKNLLTELGDSVVEIVATAPGQDWRQVKRQIWMNKKSREKPF